MYRLVFSGFNQPTGHSPRPPLGQSGDRRTARATVLTSKPVHFFVFCHLVSLFFHIFMFRPLETGGTGRVGRQVLSNIYVRRKRAHGWRKSYSVEKRRKALDGIRVIHGSGGWGVGS